MKKKSPTLDTLLAQCDEDKPMPDDLKEWEQLRPVGKEFGAAKGIIRNISADSLICDDESLSDGIDD